MKKLFSLILLGGFAFLHACVGPVGPPGPPGVPGQDGQVLLGEVFEVDVNFTAANNYTDEFNLTPPIFASDVVLIYIKWETLNGNTIWRLLPQSVFFDEGVLVYNYDFSRVDFSIFLETTFDPALLSNSWTRNQRFRIVIIPAEFGSARIDYNDYDGVMNLLGISETDIVTLKSKTEN
jgi:hypothetical protein